jgi:hypothetical protein
MEGWAETSHAGYGGILTQGVEKKEILMASILSFFLKSVDAGLTLRRSGDDI